MKFERPHLHIVDADVHRLLHRPKERLATFLEYPLPRRHALWLRLSPQIRKDLAAKMANDDFTAMLEAVDPGQATDMLRQLPPRRRTAVLVGVHERLRDMLVTLLAFDPDTAAGIMSLDYIQVEDTDTFTGVAEHFRAHEKRTGRPPAILVLCGGKLVGHLPGWELGLHSASEKVRKHVRPVITVGQTAHQRDVLHIFRGHPHGKIVVINERGDALGIIYSDDVLRLLQEQESLSLFAFAGVKDEEAVTDTTLRKVRQRYVWLVINLATAFLAAFTVSIFEDTIAAYVLLAVYMPIVAGMGGNAATQTLAVLVRGITLRQIELRTAWKTLRREVAAGMVNGVINGILVAGVVVLVHGDVRLAFVLALAMIINLIVAGFFGTLVPLLMRRLGKDPATSATIFITTATDVLGFMAFLGLGSLLL